MDALVSGFQISVAIDAPMTMVSPAVHRTAPRVSVIMALYNGSAYILSTLKNLQQQQCSDFEIVTVDDGSHDDTAAIVSTFSRQEKRLRLIRQSNGGVSNAWNRGILESRGEYVAFLDQDDLWHPDKLAEQVAFLDQHRELALAGCLSSLLDEELNETGWRFGGNFHGWAYRDMLQCDLVAGGSVAMVRRSAFSDAGGFDERPEVAGRSDWDQWIRIARQNQIGTIGRVRVGYRRHQGCYSRNHEQMLAAGRAVIEKASKEDPGLEEAVLQRARARDAFGIACLCLADRQIGQAWHCIHQSLQHSLLPMVGSVDRWGVLALLCAASVLPERRYRHLLGFVGRLRLGTRIGRSFT